MVKCLQLKLGNIKSMSLPPYRVRLPRFLRPRSGCLTVPQSAAGQDRTAGSHSRERREGLCYPCDWHVLEGGAADL